MKFELKYKSWDKISIALYKEILQITTDENATDIEKQISILALLMEVDEDELWSLSIPELQTLLPQIDFMNSFEFDKNWKSKHIKLNEQKFDVCVDMTKFSVAQYVDFQTYWGMKDNVEHLHELLSTILIPHGHSYNEGYDIAEVQQTILNHCPITTSNALLFFYLLQCLQLTKAFQICLSYQIKKMEKKKSIKKDPKMLEKLKEAEQMLQYLDGFH